MSGQPGILFTAFEPSGDALAAPVISEIRRSYPDLPIWALGGQHVKQAGAQVLQTTTDRAVMLLGAVSEIKVHRDRLAMLKRWLKVNPIQTLVPVDSPAANWSVCKLVRLLQPQAKIIHLAAPQLWAWAPWRIRKLRRLTDHVMCLLPFEAEWFNSRGVPATFVGHPIFDQPSLETKPLTAQGPHVALLPGSRKSEIKANLPAMLLAILRLREKHDGLITTICAANAAIASQIESIGEQTVGRHVWSQHFVMTIGTMDQTIQACDVVCVVSGTATLHVAKHHKPMVTVYRINRLAWNLLGRWIIQTRTFTLPNLIAKAHGLEPIVPELIPHFGKVQPLVETLDRLLNHPDEYARQQDLLRSVTNQFQDVRYTQTVMKLLKNLTSLTS